MGKENIEEKTFMTQDTSGIEEAAAGNRTGIAKTAVKTRSTKSIIKRTGSETVAAREKGVSFGIVKEINVGEMSQETRDVIIQIWELPVVFTRTEFLRKLGAVEKSFRQGLFSQMRAIPVEDFDYVALVKSAPAGRQNEVVVKVDKDEWQAARNTDDGSGNAAFSKIRSAKIYGE